MVSRTQFDNGNLIESVPHIEFGKDLKDAFKFKNSEKNDALMGVIVIKPAS